MDVDPPLRRAPLVLLGVPSQREVALAILAAVAVRALIVSITRGGLEGDAGMYQLFADNLREHGTYSLATSPPWEPAVLRPPAFAFFLAGVQALFGPGQLGVRVVQVLLSSVSVVFLACAVGGRVPWARRTVLWLPALLPFDGYYAAALLSETLCTALVVGAFGLVLRPHRWWTWGAAGVCLGGATLAREVFLVMPAAFGVLLLLLVRPTRASLGRRIRRVIALGLGAAIAISPWTLRNYAHFKTFIPVSRGLFGFNIWIGTWELDGAWQDPQRTQFPTYAFQSEAEHSRFMAEVFPVRYEPQGDQQLRRLAWANLTTRPWRVIGSWFRRFPRMWLGSRNDLFSFEPEWLHRGQPVWYALKLASWALNLAVLSLATAAFFLRRTIGRRTRLTRLVLAIPVVILSATYFPFHSTESRFSQPVMPLVACLAALTVSWIARRKLVAQRA